MYTSRKLLRYVSSLLIVFTVFVMAGIMPNTAYGQYFADITMELNPSFPKVGDLATARVVSSDVNLDFQNITWYVNGERKLSGIAKTSTVFSVEAGVKQYTIKAVIGEAPRQVVREFSFTPGEVIMLWEAVDSYVPFGYLGKALMPAEGVVKITAIPVGAPSLDKLFFVWKQGYDGLGTQSGYGKNSIILTNTVFLDSVDVEVEVSSSDGSFLSRGEISIPRANADIRLSSKSPSGQMLFEKNDILSVYGNEADIFAIPYYMPTRNNLKSFVFSWTLNGIEYTGADSISENSIFIGKSPAPIDTKIIVESFKHLLQEATAQKRILFQ